MKHGFTPLDFEIIKLLNADARLSSNHLAKKLNVSQRTIKNHLDILVQKDVIKNVAIVNPEIFGYNNIVDIFIWTKEEESEETYNFLKQMHEISYCSKHWENETISIQARFKKFQDLTDFMNNLKRNKKILRLEYTIVPEILYDSYSWLPKIEDFS